MSIKEAAEAFTLSYARAMQSGSLPSVTRHASAANLASHYGPGMTSFMPGAQIRQANNDVGVAAVESHLKRFDAAGLGYDISMVEHEISVVSEQSALCFITWEIRPREGAGVEGWRWRNVYGFRSGDDGKGFWELAVSDEEVMGLARRVPGFFERKIEE